MRVRKRYIPLFVCIVLLMGFFIGKNLRGDEKRFLTSKSKFRNKLNKLMDFIDNDYVDAVNTDSIVDIAVNDILEQLDPHSVYIPKDEQAQITENMRGDFVGIGVNFYIYNDSLAIIKPVENGPSARAGLKPGDRILYADRVKLYGRNLPNDRLVSFLKGAEGSKVDLVVYRKSENKKIKLKVMRGSVPIKSVDAALLLDYNTAYIKINRFAETTFEEFQDGLVKLKKIGAKRLVIDLRENGGGYMEEAVEIADELLKDRELIVFTKDKKGTIQKTYATKNGNFEDGQVYVLINENSASASEILAGAIQDNDRGVVVGRRSFGKGLVQQEMTFEDGSAVRLTVARYFTPTGRSIQKSYSKGNESYNKESDSRFENGELYEKDSIKVVDSLKFRTPKGKLVYGGGGIVPDVFVPLALEQGTESTSYLLQSGLVGNFVFEQLDSNRREFRGIIFKKLLSKMDHTDYFFDGFQRYVNNYGLNINLYKNKEIVKTYITAEFARQLYNESYYYKVLLKNDAMIKAVLAH